MKVKKTKKIGKVNRCAATKFHDFHEVYLVSAIITTPPPPKKDYICEKYYRRQMSQKV